ncbi:hypothetical protein, partial [Escherichia coli]|uniref:hypothetical protein n=1 Tax=Escherichia coli TaxID=562 RepID=UPI001787D1AD
MISFLKKISDDNSSSGYDNGIQFSDSDLKDEISMLLTSRPLFPDLEDLTYICDSVINYGVNSSLLNIVTQEEQTLEIIRRITIALKRFEPRISDIILLFDRLCKIHTQNLSRLEHRFYFRQAP